MQFRVRQAVGAPPELAFDLLADLRSEPQWGRIPDEPQLLTGLPVGAGSRFLAVLNGRRYEAAIRTHDRPRLLEIDLVGTHLTVRGTFRFAPLDGGTVLDADLDLGARGPMRLVLPSFRSTIATELPHDAARFAAFCGRWAEHLRRTRS